MKRVQGFILLAMCAVIVLLAAQGSTVEERDVTPVLILIPIAVRLIVGESRAKRRTAPRLDNLKAALLAPHSQKCRSDIILPRYALQNKMEV